MRTLTLTLILLVTSTAFAQTPNDPSGHWRGTVDLPGTTLELNVDLARGEDGTSLGTVSSSTARNVPLTKVTVDGRSISFSARSDQPFTGTLAADSKTIAGSLTFAGSELPLELVRTGEAKIELPPTSPAIAKAYEGTWKGALPSGERVILTLTNQPNGRAIGRFVSVDEGGLLLYLKITEQPNRITLTLTAVDGVYAATLSPDGAQLNGVFTEGTASMPLVLTR